jgi:hypothetical protein
MINFDLATIDISKVTHLILPHHRCTQGGKDKDKKLSHKNAVKQEKRGPPRFSDNPNYTPQKNLNKTPGTPSSISNYCASMYHSLSILVKVTQKWPSKLIQNIIKKIQLKVPTVLDFLF